MELEGRSILIKTQASHEDYPEIAGTQYRDIDYNKIGKNRNKKCFNRVSRGGVLIGLYSPDSIVTHEENDKTYCFTPEDISKIMKHKPYTNPYTGKEIIFSPEQKKQIYKQSISINQPLNIDLIQLNENRLCPLFFSQHRNIGFTSFPHSVEPITLDTIPADYINVSMHLSPLTCGDSGESESPSIESDIYRVKLTDKFLDRLHPSKKTLVNVDDITKISRVYDSMNDELSNIPGKKSPSRKPEITGEKKIYLSKDILHKISHIISASDKGKDRDIIFPVEDIEVLKKNKIVEDTYITLCKGVDFDKVIKDKNIKVGDKIFVKFDDITLWSTNICTGLIEAMNYRYGAVIVAQIPPSIVLFDLRYAVNLNISKVLIEPSIIEVEVKFITEGKSFSNIRRPGIVYPPLKYQSKTDIYDTTISTIKNIFI